MAASGRLTFSEIGERWPEALVLWDRDIASQGWTPVFWWKPALRHPGVKLSAFDVECPHALGEPVREPSTASACRCVTWTGAAWITVYAESYQAVRAALGGAVVPLEGSGSRMLWYMLPHGCAAEITPASFIVPYILSGRSDRYDLSLAAGIVSFLLDGVDLHATGHVIRRIRLTTGTTRDGYPGLSHADLGARYVRIDDVDERIVIRIRASEAALIDLGPEVPVVDPMQFLVVDRTCPHCGRIPERYRVLRGGSHVCLACGRSSPPR